MLNFWQKPDSPVSIHHHTRMTANNNFNLGSWRVITNENKLADLASQTSVKFEPKSMELLQYLAHRQGPVVSKQALMDNVWPGVIVADDALTRTISRLHKALGDDSKPYRFIETVPKRGYLLKNTLQQGSRSWQLRFGRAIALGLVVAALLGSFAYWYSNLNDSVNDSVNNPANQKVAELLDRANAFYIKLTPKDVESAIILYEQVLQIDANNSSALAGLANAIVQKLLRWPTGQKAPDAPSIASALLNQQFATPAAVRGLNRAQSLVERGLKLNPNDADLLKAMALVYSAQGHLAKAETYYLQAIRRSASAWVAQIKLGKY